MNTRRFAMGVAIAAALLLVTTSCGKVAEKATEKVAEKATGCKNIDVNGNGGASTDCNGVKTQVGSSADLPDGWPSGLKPLKGWTIVASSTSTQDGQKVMIASFQTTTKNAKKVYADIKKQLKDAGFTITSDTFTTGSGGAGGGLQADDKDYNLSVYLGADTTGGNGNAVVNYSLSEKSAEEKKQDATTTTSESSSSNSNSSSVDAGDGTSLPDGWPSDLKLPSSWKITQASATTSNGVPSYVVGAESSSSDIKGVYDDTKALLTDAGYTISTDTYSSTSGSEGGVLIASNDSYDVQATVGSGSSGSGVSIYMQVTGK